jgi:hypothetical protein
MRLRYFSGHYVVFAAILAGAPDARAGSLTYSHNASALPGAAGPAISLASITGTNDGTNYTFTLKFFNSTIEGPSSNNPDAVYGFINLDSDNNKATGVSGPFLDSHGSEAGFGRYSPGGLGIDAFISLSSEGLPVHSVPGLVDLITTNGFGTVATVPVTYTNAVGATRSTLSITIPLSTFSNAGINLSGPGNFAAVVGNVNDATDFLGPSAVPEPASVVLLALGTLLPLVVGSRLKRGATREAASGRAKARVKTSRCPFGMSLPATGARPEIAVTTLTR